MRPGDTRFPLIAAGVAAGIAYLVIGASSPFDLLHYLHAHAHKHAGAIEQTALTLPDDARPKAGFETHPLEEFDTVELDGETATTIAIGDVPSVLVTDAPGRADLVQTEVHRGKLIVTGSGGQLKITVPHLHKLQINRAGGIELVNLRDPLAITINGVASLKATGAVDSLDLVLNGASKLDLAKLEAKNVSIRMNGVSDAEVFATETLTAKLNGPGRVRYLGDPHVTSSVAWPGSVAPISRAS